MGVSTGFGSVVGAEVGKALIRRLMKDAEAS